MSDRPIIVLGSGGQVGSALLRQLGDQALGLDKDQIDFTNPTTARDAVIALDPAVVINAAAYTAVDKAEQETELAELINATTPAAIADWASEEGVPFIHYSTDYVYPGNGTKAWKEDDTPGPLSVYGKTKLLGDQKILASEGLYLIFRTSWVFDADGKNFVNTMLKLGTERETLRVVADQIGAPTYADDIAFYTIKALEKITKGDIDEFPSGVYHLGSRGEISWHGFAEAIFEEARSYNIPLVVKEVQGIKTEEYPTPAARPKNSRLDMQKLKDVFDLEMPEWQDALTSCMFTKFGEKE